MLKLADKIEDIVVLENNNKKKHKKIPVRLKVQNTDRQTNFKIVLK
jgi:hypothetical protein